MSGDHGDDDVGDKVSSLQAITGLSRESCAAMLSRAGGDVTTAVNRHFAAHDNRDGNALASTSGPASQPRPSQVGEKRRHSSTAARRESPAKARFGSGGTDTQQRSGLSFFQKGHGDRTEPSTDHAPTPIHARATPKTDDESSEIPESSDPTSKADETPADGRTIPTLALHRSAPEVPSTEPTTSARTGDTNTAWPTSEKDAPYLILSRCFDETSSSAKRVRKGDLLSNLFVEIMDRAPHDVLAAVYLTFGRCAERHEVGSELVVGGATVGNCVADVAGVSKLTVWRMNDTLGDLGDVAAALKRRQVTLARPKPLTVRVVLETLRAIANEKGSGSAGRKKDRVLGLMRAAREGEIRWLTRTLIRNMRIGANKTSVLHALAAASEQHHSGRDGHEDAVVGREDEAKLGVTPAAAAVQRAYSLCPSVDVLVPALVAGGVPEAVRVCTMRPFTPVKPMLASITAGAADAVARICKREEDEEDLGSHTGKTFLAEYKYDGVRAQIHVAPPADGSDVPWEVKIFSRNCEDRTAAFPDVVNIILEGAENGSGLRVDPSTGRGGGGLIIDAEVVGIDRTTGRLRAFQDLASRPRGGVNEAELAAQKATDVVVFAFDLVWVGDTEGVITGDTTALHDMSLRDRRSAMAKALPGLGRMPGRLELARSVEVEAPPSPVKEESVVQADDDDRLLPAIETVQSFMLESLDAACEGVMLKRLDGAKSRYSPSKRSDCWLKLKKDYCESLRDSLDLVPIGAWLGQGRKEGWYSPFQQAVYDPETETYQSMCRCMSGFTDEFYKTRRENFGKPPSIIDSGIKPPIYDTLEQPDVWFNPTEVWEIRGADLTLSPKHRAAAGARHETRGISLRFPRFICVRDDKNVDDASGPNEVATLFDAQQARYDGQGESAARRLAEQAALNAEADKDEEDSENPEDDEGDRAAGDGDEE